MNKASSQSHQARKRFGQNFLIDGRIIDEIVLAIAPKASDRLVEIGPGQGALTEPLLKACPKLQAIELDRDLIPKLTAQFAHYNHFIVHEADALSFDFATLINDSHPLRLVGNLPYNVATPLIFHLLSYGKQILDMHFMLQKEVVQRMAATSGDKHYGRLSLMTQYHCRVDTLFEVPPHCFRPAPKVDSAIVRLSPYPKLPCPALDLAMLNRVVLAAFQQRRKTLRNTLKALISGDTIESLGINPSLRPENLSLMDYVRISDHLTKSASAL